MLEAETGEPSIDPDDVGVGPLQRLANEAMRRLTQIGQKRWPGDDPFQQVPFLASIAVCHRLGPWVAELMDQETRSRVMEAVNSPHPYSWTMIADATGFSTGSAAATWFDPARREQRAQDARERRAAAKSASSPRRAGPARGRD